MVKPQRIVLGVLLAGALVSSAGCAQIAMTAAFLWPFGPGKIDAEFPLEEKRVVVAFIATHTIGIQEPDAVRQIQQRTWNAIDKNAGTAELVPLAEVARFRTEHLDLEDQPFAAGLGRHFDTDLVVLVRLDELTFRQGATANYITRGYVEGQARVFDMADEARVCWEKLISFSYPPGAGRPSGNIEARRFRREMIPHIVAAFAKPFYRHDRKSPL